MNKSKIPTHFNSLNIKKTNLTIYDLNLWKERETITEKSNNHNVIATEKSLETDVLCIIICSSVCLNDNCRDVWKIWKFTSQKNKTVYGWCPSSLSCDKCMISFAWVAL